MGFLQKLQNNVKFQFFLGLFGLFLANATVTYNVTETIYLTSGALIPTVPIGVAILLVDIGTEVLIVVFHDRSMVTGKVRRLQCSLMIALLGQIAVAVCWIVLFSFAARGRLVGGGRRVTPLAYVGMVLLALKSVRDAWAVVVKLGQTPIKMSVRTLVIKSLIAGVPISDQVAKAVARPDLLAAAKDSGNVRKSCWSLVSLRRLEYSLVWTVARAVIVGLVVHVTLVIDALGKTGVISETGVINSAALMPSLPLFAGPALLSFLNELAILFLHDVPLCRLKEPLSVCSVRFVQIFSVLDPLGWVACAALGTNEIVRSGNFELLNMLLIYFVVGGLILRGVLQAFKLIRHGGVLPVVIPWLVLFRALLLHENGEGCNQKIVEKFCRVTAFEPPAVTNTNEELEPVN